jgi:imidazolonepropionase-like amidohydrolase
MRTTASCATIAALVAGVMFIWIKASADSKSVAFIHATVIDATGSVPMPDATVLLNDDRIVAVGRTGSIVIPNDAEVVDSTGQFIIPGLWDMHVHLGNYWDGKKTLARLAAYGVMGVRDMASPVGDILRLRQDTRNSRLGGSRIVAAGPILQRPLPFQLPPMVRTVATPAEARTGVEDLKRQGVDFIKVGDTLERDTYFAVANESKRLGIPFVGHLPVVVSASEASRAGQRSIEHFGSAGFQGLLIACSKNEQKLRAVVSQLMSAAAAGGPAPDATIFGRDFLSRLVDTYDTRKAAALFALFAKNRTWNVPTLVAVRSVFDAHRPNMNASDLAAAERVWEKDLQMLTAMKDAGVPLLAGTDVPFGTSTPPLFDELILLVKAGLTPMEALQAATRNAAMFLGRSRTEGTVERGKLANLVVLDGNPLTDIANIARVSAVVQAGRLIQQTSPH